MTKIRICQICGCARKTFICFMLSVGITEDAKRDAIKKMEEMWDAE